MPNKTNQHILFIFKTASRLILKLTETTAFKQFNIKYHFAPIPLCPNALPFSDEYFECLMRYNTQPFLHATGSSKMGPAKDQTAVVDPELRVYGISGLRVADASIMPTQVSGNTHAPTVMIGEKAAELIKKFWSNKLFYE
ncbi:hypothetical protein Anas_04617 [Armadillidium nasatum]|uniref:Glucose-methanol-choline oxidoreductase C-terminal domain-containing protein n=1 Tax=Armadillidium nasatum TaxID=96803 RepID=A0A5N5SIW5_9CRUS|nr:hypothetical protein Anas_04617 [Armadillidium nasatum]